MNALESAKLSWRELRHRPRFSLLFIINLSLGLIGISLLSSVDNSVSKTLQGRSQAILGADLRITARRQILEPERVAAQAQLPQGSEIAETYSLYSMIRIGSKSRLVQLMAFTPNYPLYGTLGFSGTGQPLETGQAWASPELASQMGIRAGTRLRLGEIELSVTDTVIDDPSYFSVAAPVAPRLYLLLDTLQTTGLIKKGSTFRNSLLFRLPDNQALDPVKEDLNTALPDPGIRIRSHTEASQNSARVLHYLNDYLGLVSLIAFFFASMGTGFLYRQYFAQRINDIAIMMSLSATRTQAIRIQLLQLALLGLFAAIPAVTLSTVFLQFLPAVLGDFLPKGTILAPSLQSMAIVLVLAVFGVLLICWPMVWRIRSIQPAQLFSEFTNIQLKPWSLPGLTLVPALLAFWGLAVWQAQSWIVGSLFFASFIGSGGVLYALCYGLIQLMGMIRIQKSLNLKLAVRNIGRNAFGTLSAFLAVGLAALLLNLLPQIKVNLETELTRPEDSKIPSLFLFDIQPEQLETLKSEVKSLDSELGTISPMIRARLSRVNGEDFQKPEAQKEGTVSTREQERERRFRNRGFNLSFREKLSSDETITEGVPFSGIYDPMTDAVPEVSVERRFAQRMGFSIGDQLEFDIQGVPIEGQIVNFRSVRWSSFKPNFFVQFQAGVLDEAPKTYLASIPPTEPSKRNLMQDRIVNLFPNISIVDVSRIIRRLLGLIEQMSVALNTMALLALIAGYVVLFSIGIHQAQSRAGDINLMKVLGARRQRIASIFDLEIVGIGFLASIFGTSVSLGVSWVLSYFMFDALWAWAWKYPVAIIAGTTLSCWIISKIATGRVLARKPSEVFGET